MQEHPKNTVEGFIPPQDGAVSLFWAVEQLLGGIASKLFLIVRL